MATFIEQSDLVVQTIRDQGDAAELWLDETRIAMNGFAQAMLNITDFLSNNPLLIDTSAVNDIYVPTQAQTPDVPAAPTEPTLPQMPADVTVGSPPALPTPPNLGTVPTLPNRGEVSIGPTAWNQIFQQADDLIARVEVQRAQEAANRAAAYGGDQLDETAAIALQRSEDEADMRRSQVAINNAIERSKAEREDQHTLSDDEIALYGSRGNVEISNYSTLADQARSNYSVEIQLQLDHLTRRSEQEIANYRALSQEQRQSWLQKVQLDLQRFRLEWGRDTTSESTRHAYEALKLDHAIRPPVEISNHNLRFSELQIRNLVDSQYRLVEIYAQLSTAILATSDVSLGSSVGISLGGSVDNP